MSQRPLYIEFYKKNAAPRIYSRSGRPFCASLRSRKACQNFTRDHKSHFIRNCIGKCSGPDLSQNADTHFVRACTVETHCRVSQEKCWRPLWAPWSSIGLYAYHKKPLSVDTLFGEYYQLIQKINNCLVIENIVYDTIQHMPMSLLVILRFYQSYISIDALVVNLKYFFVIMCSLVKVGLFGAVAEP